MAGFWQTAEDIIEQVDELFFSSGGRSALRNGNGHLYTGPSDEIHDKILGFKLSNHEIAARRSRVNDAILIDDTLIGRFLTSFKGEGVYKYFYRKHYPNIEKGFEEADVIWRHASRLFVESLWGSVTTTICGANRTRIFYTKEIRIAMEDIPWMIHKLMKSTDIEIINGMPMGEYRRLYDPFDYEPVYRHMCITQQQAMLEEAHRLGSADAMRMFLHQLEAYCLDQGDVPSGFDDYRSLASLETPEDRLAWKNERLRQFITDQVRRDAVEYSFALEPIVLSPAAPAARTMRHSKRKLVAAQ